MLPDTALPGIRDNYEWRGRSGYRGDTMTYRGATAGKSGPRFKFIGETIAEMKKVVWLTRREIAYLTALVIIVAVSVGLALGVLDYIFARLVNDILLGG
jgi:preprotein translocase subunit SecE